MFMKTKWLLLGLLIIGGAIGFALLNRRPTQQVAMPEPRRERPVAVAPPPEPPPIEVAVEPTTLAEPVKDAQVQPTPKPKAPKIQAQTQPANTGKEPLHDPAARDALALVGIDPNAEQYWLDAIYDTSLPDKEREDLMEDLNETGFADPKNLTADDLPLIASRLALIQQIAPNTDPFMAEHLGEAYKDLANMYNRVASQ